MMEVNFNILIWILVGLVQVGTVLTVLNFSPQPKTVWMELEKQIEEDQTLVIFQFDNQWTEHSQIEFIKSFNIKEKQVVEIVDSRTVIFKNVKILTNNQSLILKLLSSYEVTDLQVIKKVPLQIIVEFSRR